MLDVERYLELEVRRPNHSAMTRSNVIQVQESTLTISFPVVINGVLG